MLSFGFRDIYRGQLRRVVDGPPIGAGGARKNRRAERCLGLFQQRWQARRILSFTVAGIFKIRAKVLPFASCNQHRPFHLLWHPTVSLLLLLLLSLLVGFQNW